MTTEGQTQDPAATADQGLIPSKGLASEVEGGAGAGPEGGAEESVANGGNDQVVTGEVLVDYNGAQRRVSISDLVEAHSKRSELDQAQKSIQKQLQELGTATALQNLVSSWDDEKRRRLEEAMHQIDQGSYGQDDDDDIIRDVRDIRRPTERTRQQDPEISELKSAVQSLLQERHTQSLAKRIGDEMESYPVFQESESAKKFGYEAIVNAFQANPRGDLGELVANIASKTHKLFSEARERALPRPADGSSFPNIPTPTKKFSGDDLNSGELLNHLLGVLGEKR